MLRLLIYLVPKSLMSRAAGLLSRTRWPKPFGPMLVRWFANRYRLNLAEAERTLPEYLTIQDLFTRRLKPGARLVANEVAVHPADAELTVSASINAGLLLQVKGWTYTVQEFLNEASAEVFENGTQLTYYLCPTDYHRVHSPVDGEVVKVTYIPGNLWPVNNWSVTHIHKLFVRNERVVVWIKTNHGLVAVVMVGATNVGQMTLSFHPELITNKGQPAMVKTYEPAPKLVRGGELGVFNMGSTVVVLYPPAFPLADRPPVPHQVKMGGSLHGPLVAR
ncbi:MAG: archaetidylserine decarboxylase [Bdellovibrionales bacterium]